MPCCCGMWMGRRSAPPAGPAPPRPGLYEVEGGRAPDNLPHLEYLPCEQAREYRADIEARYVVSLPAPRPALAGGVITPRAVKGKGHVLGECNRASLSYAACYADCGASRRLFRVILHSRPFHGRLRCSVLHKRRHSGGYYLDKGLSGRQAELAYIRRLRPFI